MRVAAVLFLLLLTACPSRDCEPRPGAGLSRAEPDVTLIWTDPSGAQISSSSGSEIQLGSTLSRCWSTEAIQLRNVGRATGTFRLSPPSSQFQYDAGPYTLAPGEQVSLDVRIDATGELTEAASLTHELSLEQQPADQCAAPSPTTFTLVSRVLSSSIEAPVLDFRAVVIGDSKSLDLSNVSGLSGDFSTEGGLVRFTPTREGTQLIRADWRHDDRCLPIAARIIGDGVQSPFRVESPNVNFGDAPIGTLVEREVRIETWPDERPTARLGLLGAQDFTLVERWSESTVTERVDGGLVPASHVVTVQFRPSTGGAKSTSLQFFLGGRPLLIPLRGVGTP